ncbi:kinase domain protein (macronuclear) [Tetrahymena thermophila SB210]|uniref:Kinase domain protein n=1 Tax=Tetrahymena thermophila (strain SB210) TaxID=312017 RepID=Q228T9_TETTS|nr:kinase domain protein [Tetrahymena thermophila SB210]EAR81810.3 kinase domain protein [Tetrahymena thermophila SB210]|eukprot:XP_001029473.3 kinase domain protein [Tetrahymena thermophila SB210]
MLFQDNQRFSYLNRFIGNYFTAGEKNVKKSKKQSVFKLGEPKTKLKCFNVKNLELDFRLNDISNLSTFSLALPSFQNIQVLDLNLGANRIKDKDIPLLSSSIIKCEKLQKLTLDLQMNSFKDQSLSSLGSGLAQCPNLSYLALDLRLNNFDDAVYSSLGQALAKCTLLSTFILDLRRLSNRNVYKIASALDNKNNLKNLILKLDQNKIGNDGAQYLFSQLAKCINLESLTLQLSFVMMEDQVTSSFSFCFQKLTNLRLLDLNLSYNNLKGGKLVSSLGHAITKFSHITTLKLDLKSLNLEDGKCLTDLGVRIASCDNLSNLEVDLENTYIEGYNVSIFFSTLSKSVSLSCLKLFLMSCNTENDEFIIQIAKTLEKLKNISNLTLDLGDNEIQDQGLNKLALALKKCQKIESLTLNLEQKNIYSFILQNQSTNNQKEQFIW